MTLFKQILIAFVALGIVIFTAVGYLNFRNLNDYIQTQLGTNARHTANSLGLSIKPVIDPDDLSMVEVMINSMFDSGYYQLIKLDDVDGKELVKSEQKLSLDGIPGWFVNLVKLKSPIESSEIMTGWAKFGTLYVQSSSGLAYYELYNGLKNIFYALSIIFGIAIVFVYFGLKVIFKPLVKVKDQAEAILDNKFIIQDKFPFTTDLKQMVLAMNTIVGRVKDIFEREAKTLNKYQELLYKDSMTGVYNRRYFQTKFDEYIASEELSSGSMIMIGFKDLVNLKKILGFEKWQSLVIKIAKNLQDRANESKYTILLARLNDNDFVLLAPNANSANLESLTKQIMADFVSCFENFGSEVLDNCKVNAAIVDYDRESSLGTMLTTADVTLANARLNSNFSYKIYEKAKNNIILGKEQYKELIFKSMQDDKFKFAAQKVVEINGEFEQYELYLRLVDSENKWQMASYFMPMVNELELGATLDIHVLNRVATCISNGTLSKDTSIAVNLGKEMISKENESKLVMALKKILSVTKQKIYLEIPNKDDMQLQSVVDFSNMVKNLGFGLGLDHFDFSTKGIEKLKEINPNYVKIQAGSIIDFFSESDSEHTRKSLEVVMESKGIKLIAIGVENEAQKAKLLELGISSMQGNYIDDTKNIG
ncbi:bifunctional diguanylate cyclase/phosphodiesterase [Campylobacter mucosalis]|uniref:bifunctional diguanylate cyclase/phosphodiesterase n=1 Tax=Campylobacter mucosalis TaxID=202 RepID=UPI00146FF56E|nr:LapD/MoxY N-terminal periplasmic domain-containing protein [Campylobacter mucosalis]